MKSKVHTANSYRFKQGELYIAESSGTIVICAESTYDIIFKSTCLVEGRDEDGSAWTVGEYWEATNGDHFIPFKDTLELTGE